MKNDEKLSKELLGLAGEYAVSSELCRRGLYSQLTMGNHKRTDILLESASKMLRIQVKAKQGTVWPAVKGLSRTDDFLVFVDFASKSPKENLDFYVVNYEDWMQLVTERREIEEKRYPKISIDGENRLINPHVADGKKPYIGFDIKASRLQEFKDRWDKILSQIDPRDTQNS